MSGEISAAPISTAASEVSGVTVTGSRTIKDGSQAPTPLTVLSADQLQLAAPTSIPAALAQLPVFHGTMRPQSLGSANFANGIGQNFLALTTNWYDDTGHMTEADIQIDPSVVANHYNLELLVEHFGVVRHGQQATNNFAVAEIMQLLYKCSP